MTFDDMLKNYKALIDENIDLLFPECLDDYKEVISASRYSLLLGGKRIRPIIMLEFYKLLGGNEKGIINFAVALEMIHTYSLIHDDLPCMDNDDMRRGHPSCHKAFGEDTALLAGDALLTDAFSVAARSDFKNSKLILRAIGVLSKMAGSSGMIAGQVLDLSFEKNAPNLNQLLDMYKRKTGCLLNAASEIGCILAGADEKQIEYAREYSINVGIAFQIIDDILDCSGNEKLLGKPIGSDDKNEKVTSVTILGIDGAKNMAEQLTNKALNSLSRFSKDSSNLELLTKFLLNRDY